MTNDPTASQPADDLLDQVHEAVAELGAVLQRLPVKPAQAEETAKILDRLGEEYAEAAAMLRALPNRPAKRAGYSFAALGAIITAVEAEHDFAGWLAGVLTRAAAHYGSADHLVMGRSGSWEAEAVLSLVHQTAGHNDEHLGRYRDDAS